MLRLATADSNILKSLRLPLRCHLYRAARDSLKNIASELRNRFMEQDYPFQIISSTDTQLVILFVQVKNTSLVKEFYFLEPELHAFVAQKHGSLVAVLDTSRPGLDEDTRLHVAGPVKRSELGRLLNIGRDTRFVEISARNTALGVSSVRRRSVAAVSLDETTPTLDEFNFVPSSVRAIDASGSGTRESDRQVTERSVGFARARVSEVGRRPPFNRWVKWCDALMSRCGDSFCTVPAYFERYADIMEGSVDKPWPKNVLLDVEEAKSLFVLNEPESRSSDPAHLDIEDVCLECRMVDTNPSAPRVVTIIANDKPCDGTLAFFESRYILQSDELDRRYRHADGPSAGGIVRHLNAHQAFVVIPEQRNVIYAEGEFYKPGLKLGRNFDPDRLGFRDLLVQIPVLQTLNSEKGGRNSAIGTTWAEGCVFRWIDDHIDDILPAAQLAICDDGRHETCDFLLAGERNGRDVVIMIHAKASKNSRQVSASALHEVCSQATKGVGTLALFRPKKPPQADSWHGHWDGPGGEGRVDARIRRACGQWDGLTGVQIWSKLLPMLEKHSTEREVVLVLGNALESEVLYRRARGRDPAAHVIQALYLIRSTMSSVVGGGARLRIFCG